MSKRQLIIKRRVIFITIFAVLFIGLALISTGIYTKLGQYDLIASNPGRTCWVLSIAVMDFMITSFIGIIIDNRRR